MKKLILFILLLLFVGNAYTRSLQAQDNEIFMSVSGKKIGSKALAQMIRDYLVQLNLADEKSEIKISGLPQSFKTNSEVDVAVSGASQGVSRVHVENYDMPDIEPSFLMFSNHPEKVKSYGVLFSGACVLKKKVRFQFYHLSDFHPVTNDSSLSGGVKDKNPYLSFKFYNPDKSKTAKIYITGDIKGPDGNYMRAGHSNNMDFLEKKNNTQGVIYTIKPGESFDFLNKEMPCGKLFCGIYEMYLLEGSPVWFYLFSNKLKNEEQAFPQVSSSTDVHARGVYEVTDFVYDVKFLTSEKEKYIIFGDTPLRNIFPQKSLAGDYGTIYNINLYAEENTGKNRKLEIIFQPRGGVATGTFIIDGRVLEAPTTKPFLEYKIWSYNLHPREKRLIKIKTLPEGSSYYPVRIIFRSKDT